MIDTGFAKSAVVAGKTNGAPAKKPLPAVSSSSSESDSDAGSKAKPIVAAAKVVAGKLIPQKAANVSSSGSDSSSDEDAVSEPPSKQAPVVAGKTGGQAGALHLFGRQRRRPGAASSSVLQSGQEAENRCD